VTFEEALGFWCFSGGLGKTRVSFQLFPHKGQVKCSLEARSQELFEHLAEFL
jgi:hypothetical protein